jgi:hypothetical protein
MLLILFQNMRLGASDEGREAPAQLDREDGAQARDTVAVMAEGTRNFHGQPQEFASVLPAIGVSFSL